MRIHTIRYSDLTDLGDKLDALRFEQPPPTVPCGVCRWPIVQPPPGQDAICRGCADSLDGRDQTPTTPPPGA